MQRKNVRALVSAGHYNGKSPEEFKADACTWAGNFDGIEEAFDRASRHTNDKHAILDALCDFGMNSLI